MSFCTICGARQPENATFCAICGASMAIAAPAGPLHPQTVPVPPSRDAPVCPRCGAQLEPDSRFCDLCGASLDGDPAAVSHPSTKDEARLSAPAEPQPAWADAFVQPGAPPVHQASPGPQARLVIQESQTTLHLPYGKVEIIVGRDDPISNLFPDIDLTDYGGDKTGVSRQHARILFQGGRVFLEDRNSTNRTYLNDQPLEPWQLYPLHSGDEIRFGRLRVSFYL